MNRITIDFETETVEIHTDSQNGIERAPGIRARREAILAAMGYETFNMKEEVDLINAAINRDREGE